MGVYLIVSLDSENMWAPWGRTSASYITAPNPEPPPDTVVVSINHSQARQVWGRKVHKAVITDTVESPAAIVEPWRLNGYRVTVESCSSPSYLLALERGAQHPLVRLGRSGFPRFLDTNSVFWINDGTWILTGDNDARRSTWIAAALAHVGFDGETATTEELYRAVRLLPEVFLARNMLDAVKQTGFIGPNVRGGTNTKIDHYTESGFIVAARGYHYYYRAPYNGFNLATRPDDWNPPASPFGNSWGGNSVAEIVAEELAGQLATYGIAAYVWKWTEPAEAATASAVAISSQSVASWGTYGEKFSAKDNFAEVAT